MGNWRNQMSWWKLTHVLRHPWTILLENNYKSLTRSFYSELWKPLVSSQSDSPSRFVFQRTWEEPFKCDTWRHSGPPRKGGSVFTGGCESDSKTEGKWNEQSFSEDTEWHSHKTTPRTIFFVPGSHLDLKWSSSHGLSRTLNVVMAVISFTKILILKMLTKDCKVNIS